MSRKKNGVPLARLLIFAAAAGMFVCFACVALFAITGSWISTRTETAAVPISNPASAILVLAHSPEKTALITELAADFNRLRLRTTDDELMQVHLVEMAPDQMVEAALNATPGFQAMNPDASLWLDQLDLRWAEMHRGDDDIAPRRIAESSRYAVSPIVIAAWPEIADSMGWRRKPVGWSDLQERATEDDTFRWSHASTSYASGMLATLAEFYAGTGKTRALTEDDVTQQPVLDYVSDIERTVSFYGENEAVAMARMAEQGRGYLDALVVQEALVAQHNRNTSDPLVAIYPKEGTLWEDHPLALLDDPAITDNQRRTYMAFSEYLRATEQQERVLQRGFRPADLAIPIDKPGSPISAALGLNPTEPQTTLQMPGPSVVDVVRNVWWYTKRPSNVFLVVDTSGSMEGEKLENMRLALQTFIDQIQGTEDQVGMVEFAGSVYNIVPPAVIDNAHSSYLHERIATMEAGGDTALLDAIRTAYGRLQKEGDSARINAIVAMSDGRENSSRTSLKELLSQIQAGNGSGVPVVIFAIGYGEDTDYQTLRAIAEISGGQAREGDVDTINELYRLISQYF